MRCVQMRAGTADRGICLLDGTNGGKRMVSMPLGLPEKLAQRFHRRVICMYPESKLRCRNTSV